MKFKRCLVMGGGGFRFGYYLGMYAALSQQRQKPDLLLATCGGAIAAGIIQSYETDEQRKEWLSSEAMYQFWRDHRAHSNATITKTLAGVIKRCAGRSKQQPIADLFGDYLFDIPQVMPLPPVDQKRAMGLDVAIIAGRILYTKADIHQPRGTRKLFEETVFCEKRTARLLEGALAPAGAAMGGSGAVEDLLATKEGVPIEQAVRASVADMYLFQSHTIGREHYTGGIIDLVPIELAHTLADQVIVETKSPYDKLISQPALHTAFGIDGNRRLQSVARTNAHLRIDTSDMEQVLVKDQIERRINWLRNRIDLAVPTSHGAYVKMIDAQWHYGIQRTLLALKRKTYENTHWTGHSATQNTQ